MATSTLKSRKPVKLLLNIGELAQELGVNRIFIKRMKNAGFPMPGAKTTLEWALDWLKANPGFRQVDHQGDDLRLARKVIASRQRRRS